MKVGDVIDNKYVVIKEIDTGGMGVVYEVEHNENKYALKICKVNEEEDKKRFNREVRIMSSISHKNIIKILDSNLEYNPSYFVMPLCKCSLANKLNLFTNNYILIIKVMIEVCKGLKAIHEEKKVHRDLKPSNILIDNNNQILISDFGLSMFVERDSIILTAPNHYFGSEGYIPPEFYEMDGTKNATSQSDIFSVGKIMYNLATAQHPNSLDYDLLIPLFSRIVIKCTEVNLAKRYKDIDELLIDLKDCLKILTTNNPIEEINQLVNSISEDFEANKLNKQDCEELLNSLLQVKQNTEDYYLFLRKLSPIIWELLYKIDKDKTEILINEFCNKAIEYFENNYYAFEEATRIANKMYLIFEFISSSKVKIKIMETILIVSILKNRFDAMDVFGTMLYKIQTVTDSQLTIAMLSANKDYYLGLIDRIKSSQLHPDIAIFNKTLLNS